MRIIIYKTDGHIWLSFSCRCYAMYLIVLCCPAMRGVADGDSLFVCRDAVDYRPGRGDWYPGRRPPANNSTLRSTQVTHLTYAYFTTTTIQAQRQKYDGCWCRQSIRVVV